MLVHSEQQYKIKFKEWGFSKYKKRGMQNRADRGDPRADQIDRATVPIQLPNPHPPPTLFSDASIVFMDNGDMFTGYVPNDVFSVIYKPINLGIHDGEGTLAPFMPRTSGTKFRQPIHQAAYSGFLDMVKLLLEKNPTCAAVAGSDGVTAILYAAQQGHLEVVRHLVSCPGIDVNAATTNTMWTPIHQAARNGHVDIVKLLMAVNAKHDQPDNENMTPLWSAAQEGYDEIVQILIQKGVDKEIISTDGNRRPIHQAAQNGHLGVVKKLLEAGAKVDPHKDGYGKETPSPLWLAAQGGHFEVADLLIQKGADVNFSEHPSNRLPIHQAAQNGHIELVRLLLRAMRM
ncbi:uncharacterized protein TrAtP1_010019 [Trichoderma atroviride]|uniref:uncharacterized protein n=1 Tax=Hypocrea atroviridis TaxID=63577 RepID=UPI003328D91F|nr:hypothetical protein TrAtP1_010019 [Trichoderma atroviride]